MSGATAEPKSASAVPRRLFETTAQVRDLVEAFEDGTLPREEWTHAAHLTVAAWYLLWYGHGQATNRMRTAIRSFNSSHGIEQTPTSGYHETLTLFYMWSVRRCLRSLPIDGSIADLMNAVCAELDDRNIPLRYYSRDRLMSVEARNEWVPPDLAEMPDYGSSLS
ncbi:MAG: hypothetical protein H0U59_06665 [Gemmatimonadaceae bacterium]|nr:hypothetical protein [Gemmatimonadaceae bacterium]